MSSDVLAERVDGPVERVWLECSFHVATLDYDATLGAMKTLAERVCQVTRACTEEGHPIDLTWALEGEYHRAAGAVTQELRLAEPIPALCTLVVASPFVGATFQAWLS